MKLQSIAMSKYWKINLEFEYIGKDTPQRNHMAEVGFATIGGRGRAMMHYANVPMDSRCMVRNEDLMTATRIYGLTVVVTSDKTDTIYEY